MSREKAEKKPAGSSSLWFAGLARLAGQYIYSVDYALFS
jgi:hypothetical protein